MATIPRILIAGLCGGAGKTLISLGVAAAWRKQGQRVAPFKKGPDYIDAAWLSRAAECPCRNLDLFLMSPPTVVRSFIGGSAAADVAVIEGNRGLFDGMDAQGTCSTAELAKLLQCPVVLAVDCTKSTRTVAASILGCQRLDPQLALCGVILNQTARSRHESVVREAIAEICGLPVLGAVPRIGQLPFPERHLGLLPPQEHDGPGSAIEQMAAIVAEHLDLQALAHIARQAPELDVGVAGFSGGGESPVWCATACGELPIGHCLPETAGNSTRPQAVTHFAAVSRQAVAHADDVAAKPAVARIGVFRDAAFQFYYPENLEALTREGAALSEISPLRDAELPEVDALYIGGGFPETLAPALTRNQPFLDSLRRSIARGLPVYAECGGAVYLGEKLLLHDNEYPLAGVLPVVFAFGNKPQGHGYTLLETVESNPFFSVGDTLRGHEFHYTYMQSAAAKDLNFAFRVRRGYGFDGHGDGLCRGNVLASYMHVHALGAERWAPAMVRAAVRFRTRA